MDRLATTLLSGAAMGALSVAPAIANPHTIPVMPGQLALGSHSSQGFGIAHRVAKGHAIDMISLKGIGHHKTIHPKGGGGVTFYDTYTATTCGGLSGGCGTVYTYAEGTSWYKQTHTLTRGAWAWVSYKSHYNFTYNSAEGRYNYTDTFSEFNAKAEKLKTSKDKNAVAAGKFGQTETDKFNTSYSYYIYGTYDCSQYGYCTKEHVIEHDNFDVNFGETSYMLKKHVDSDSVTLANYNNHTVTTTTTGRKHHQNKYTYYEVIYTNNGLTF